MLNTFFNNSEILMYIIAAIVFIGLHFLSKKKLNFSIRVLSALAIGALIGFIFPNDAHYLKVFGTVYVKLIKLLVIPLVFVAIIRSFTQLKDKKALKSIGLKSLFWLLFTTAIGATLGVITGVVTKIGTKLEIGTLQNPNEPFKLIDALLNLIPSNVIEDAAKGNVLQVIFFAILISIAIIVEGERHPERIKPFKDFIHSAADIMNRVTKIIIQFTPYGVFGLIANAASRNDAELFKQLGLYIVLIYAIMIVHFVVIHLGLIKFVGKLNPLKFIKKVYPAQVVAFSSQSSYGTLPVTIKSLERVGVSEKVANFVAPLGANIGMNACGGIFPALVAIITANAYNVPLGMIEYLIIIVSSVISSIGVAGVPGIASVTATVVLASVGLPLEGLLLIAGVDAFVDMGRTALNVTGTMVSSTLVAKSENQLNEEVFNSN